MSGPGPKDEGVGPDVGTRAPDEPPDPDARFPTTLVSARPLDSVALDGTRTLADGPPRSERRPLTLPSELSGGRFRLLDRIGTGGMGVVYAATDRKRGERVALKTLQNLDGAGIERLKREFRTLASVSHPNLVRLRELFADGEEVFFTMDLVEGEPFLAAVHRDLASGYAGVRDKFRQLAEGLDALHALGKIHRDLKPSNVMLQKDGRVVVLDFGVACDFETEKRERSDPLAGTPAYMSPEQALGEPMSPASDWYAFGTMLYEVIAGRLPFEGPIITLLSDKTSKGPPPIAPDAAPPGLAALALELLSRNPEGRPTAREIVERLSDASELPLPEPRRPASSGMQRVEFVGRERELSELERALHRASSELVSVLVTGASGIGKTTLVREFVGDECAAKGALVLESKCFEYESVRYNALDGVIEGLRKHLERLSPEARARLTPRYAAALAAVFPALADVLDLDAPTSERLPAQPAERRRTAFLALRELLGRLGELVPLVLFLDDLQWGDGDSARLLKVLLAPSGAPPLLLIASCRSDERAASPLLSELEQSPELFRPIELRLDALSDAESHALLSRLLRREPPSSFAPVLAEARGNPFLLSELSLALAGGASGPSLAAVVNSRLRALPASALALLEVVAVAEMPLSSRVARAVAESSDGETALVALRSAKLVRATPGDAEERLQCYHDRIREVVLASLDAERSRALHRRLAIALETEPGVDAERLVGHFERAGEREKTALYAERAGEAAANALAFGRAGSFYELAFSLSGDDAERSRRVRTRLAEALEHAGRTRDAAEHYLALARDEADADLALDFRRRAASQLLSGGHLDDGLAVLDGVLEEVGLRNPKTEAGVLARLVAERARLRLRGLSFAPRAESECDAVALRRIDAVAAAAAGYTRCDFVRGALFAGMELRLALALGEKNRVARALANEILFAANEGAKQLERVEVLRREIDRLLPEVRDPRVLGYLTAARGASHLLLGDVRAATPEIAAGARVLSATGRPSFELTFVRSLWALCLQIQGSVVEAGDALGVFLADARERADLQAERYFAIYRTFGLLGLDQADHAHAELERTLVATERAGNDFLHYAALHAFVLIAIYRREERAVFERYRALHRPFFRTLLRGGQLSRAYVKVYIAYCSLSIAIRTSAATRDVAGLHAQARSLFDEKAVFASAHAHEIRAAALAFEARRGDAMDELARAADAFDSLGQTLQAAAARHRRGLLLGGERGAEEVERARRVAFELRIVNPERMFACYTPGFET
jgi:hypothetical protein